MRPHLGDRHVAVDRPPRALDPLGQRRGLAGRAQDQDEPGQAGPGWACAEEDLRARRAAEAPLPYVGDDADDGERAALVGVREGSRIACRAGARPARTSAPPVSLTTITAGEPAASCSVSSRPARTGIPMVRK